MLWVDTHRPTTLEKLDVHNPVNEQLRTLADSHDFPHLLFYGPSGAGKKTRVMALLRDHYKDNLSLHTEQRSIQATASKSVDVTVLVSNYHIEVNPSDVGVHDRAVVMTLIKEIAESAPLHDSSGKRAFKVIVISEVDRLSKAAQQALRRTMETYIATCRLVLVANSLSRIIQPLRSRCLAIRVPLPDAGSVQELLVDAAKKESVLLPEQLGAEIAARSGGNMRSALLTLEATKVQQSALTERTKPFQPEWERFIAEIALEICHEQSPKRVWEVRGKMYELLVNCVPPETLLQRLTLELLKNVDSATQVRVANVAAHFDHSLRTGSRPIVHLEAFVCQFMALYRKYLSQLARAAALPPRA